MQDMMKMYSVGGMDMGMFGSEGETLVLNSKNALVKYLLENKNSVLTRRAILERVWKDDLDVTDRVVDTAIRRLRDNLGEAAGQIKTVIGRGYRLTEE